MAHREANGLVVIDFLRERLPRFVPADVVKEYAAILKLYGALSVVGDRYSSGWNADEWKRAGIAYRPSELTKSELYLAALPMLLSGQVRLRLNNGEHVTISTQVSREPVDATAQSVTSSTPR